MTRQQQALAKAVKLLGGQTKAAERLTEFMGPQYREIKQQDIWNYMNRDRNSLPKELAEALSLLVNNQVTLSQLRPDLVKGKAA